jgi:hypothetical protein
VIRRKSALFSIIAIAVVVFGVVTTYKVATRTKFDSSVWRDSTVAFRKPYPRLQMADDILRRKLLDGLTADSLVTLLGPRPKTSYFTDWDYVYWLGPERGFISIDSEWLVIDLGADGRVNRTTVVTD